MNNKFIFFLIALFVAFFASCNNGPKIHEKELLTKNKVIKLDSVKNAFSTNNVALQLVFDQYISLSNYLVKSDYVSAKEVVLLLKSITKQNLVAKNLQTAIFGLNNTSDLSVFRTKFSDFSDALLTEIRKAGKRNSQLFLVHCPMAKNDKGAYWLSTKNEVLNPYFGDEMLTCGEVVEEVK